MTERYPELPLFQMQKEAAARDEAIARVESNNTPNPIDEAERDALQRLPKLDYRVTSDVILPDLSKYEFTDNRAVAVVMRRLVGRGALEATGSFRPSQRTGNHRAPKRIYINKIRKPAF